MLNNTDFYNIVESVFAELDIPEDIYKIWTYKDMESFSEQYTKDSEYIAALVDIELTKYDTSDMYPSDIEDIREDIIAEVDDKLQTIKDNYYRLQDSIRDDAYASIVKVLKSAYIKNVSDVDTEYEPADPDVGIFDEERRIVFTLSNGYTISFEVSFDD